jgi:hypothetical protein
MPTLYFILSKNSITTFLQKPDETNERGKTLKRLEEVFLFSKIKKKIKTIPSKIFKKGKFFKGKIK